MLKKYSWPLMLAALIAVFAIGVWPTGSSQTSKAGVVQNIAQQIRCPTCSGLSVAESESPLARSSLDEIKTQVDQGHTQAQIKDYFVSKYGPTALMAPPRKGITAAAWALPIVLGIIALFAAALAIRRWGRGSVRTNKPSREDRRLVERAMRGTR